MNAAVVTVESMWPLLLGAVVLAGVVVALMRRRVLFIRWWCMWAVAVPAVVGLFWWGPAGIALLAITAGVITALALGALMGVPSLDCVVVATGVSARLRVAGDRCSDAHRGGSPAHGR